jgi:hypothetical protein
MNDCIAAAKRVVTEERRQVEVERDAFAAFERRVVDLPTVASPLSPPSSATRPSLKRMYRAYAETVMDVAHYETTYGDTVAESLAAEFGPDVAAALRGSVVLTPGLRDAVRRAGAAARRDREAFLDVLEREAESLAVAADAVRELRTDLDAIDPERGGFHYLRHLRSRTDDLEARIERVAARRQETLDGHRTDLSGTPDDLPEYLYADLSSPYPVLATVASLSERLEALRRQVDRAIAAAP